ncbi:MAG: sugar transferase, partial [Acidimicrobiales bacterium]
MSLVGPRPEMLHLHADGDAAFARTRVAVRPGCTGLWQIGAHSYRLIWDAPQYDEFYVRHASVRLDCWILWLTARQMLGLGRPVELTNVPGWARRPRRMLGLFWG